MEGPDWGFLLIRPRAAEHLGPSLHTQTSFSTLLPPVCSRTMVPILILLLIIFSLLEYKAY